MDEGKGGDQEEAGEDGRQAGLQLPQLPQLLTYVLKPDYGYLNCLKFWSEDPGQFSYLYFRLYRLMEYL